jgi:hypothetical protein
MSDSDMGLRKGPIAYATMDQDPPWSLESYRKVGGYEGLRRVL